MANRRYNLRIGRWFKGALATKVKLGHAPNFFVMKLQNLLKTKCKLLNKKSVEIFYTYNCVIKISKRGLRLQASNIRNTKRH